MAKRNPLLFLENLEDVNPKESPSSRLDINLPQWEGENIKAMNSKYILIILAYLVGFIVAELSTTYYNVNTGLIINALLIFTLLVHSSLIHDNTGFSNILRAMMILPLIRIVGLSVPLAQITPLYWFLIISIPLFAATITFVKIQPISRQDLGLVKGNIPVQLLIAASGIVLGFIEYQILSVEPLIPRFDPAMIIFAGLILLIGTGVAEELLFRGVLQKNMEKVLGPAMALLLSSLLFTVLHIGWQNPMDLLFVFAVSMFYGFAFYKTKCLWGVTLSHGISNSILFLVMPFIIF